MRPKHLTYAPTAADSNGIGESQSAVDAANLDIDGVLTADGVATLDIPRHVSITSDGDDSPRTFTVTGTDRYGATLTESIVGPNATTANGTKNFKTVTSIHINGATTGNITMGTADAFESPISPVGRYNILTHGVRLSSGAHLTHSVQYTVENPFDPGFDEYSANWETSGGEQGANYSGKIDFPVGAVRLSVTNYIDGSVDSFDIVQV